jgi:hypothetical protein
MKKELDCLVRSGAAITALVDMAHQRITALCNHLGVNTGIVPDVPAHYEVFPAPPKEKSDDKTRGKVK